MGEFTFGSFLRVIFGTWEFRPAVMIVLFLFGAFYLRGWLTIRRKEQSRQRPRVWRQATGRSPQGELRPLAEPWRLVAYGGGLALLALSLQSGLDTYGSLLLSVHMLQHFPLLMLSPILLWLGNPYPFVIWGLPRPARLRVSALMASPSPFRAVLRQISKPMLAWMYLVVVTVIWHDSNLYSLAQRRTYVHDLEHIMFFVAGMLFWWHIVGSAPRIHPYMSHLRRAALAVAVVPANMAVGAAIALAEKPLYPYYEGVPRLWGISVLDDQMTAGVIMWVPGSMMYFMAALALIAVYFIHEERKSALASSRWATNDSLLENGVHTGGSQP